MTTEKNETIRLQMMKENCNPESGNCDGFCHLCKKALDMAIKALNVEKTAEWIFRTSKSAQCSKCGHIQFTNGEDMTGNVLIHKALYHYCPMCGANMKESEEEV